MSTRASWFFIGVFVLAIACLPNRLLHAELVGYWNFDGNVDDHSGTGNDGELFDATYSDNVPSVIGSGQSLSFELDTDHVFIEADESLDSEEFTLSMFVYDRVQQGAFERLTSREGDTFETAINVHPPFGGIGEISYYAAAGGGWQWTSPQWGADDSILLDEENWQHLAYVANVDEGLMSIYLDGNLIFESPDPWYATPGGFMHIGNRHNDVEGFDGLLDDVALWDEVLTPDQIKEIAEGGVARFLNADPFGPLNDGSLTDPAARLAYVHDTLGTWMGDSNWDLEFNSSDLVFVFGEGKYETGALATWQQGDWNGDMEFNSSDMVTAFADGGYEIGPMAAVMSVPEPGSFVLLSLGIGLLFRPGKRSK